MSTAEELIPLAAREFARDFVDLAKKHGLDQASITMRFNNWPEQMWSEQITVVWEAGRHREDAMRFSIHTSLRLSEDLSK